MNSHADRILALLGKMPSLDDDQIAAALEISPRQTVNQACRALAAKGFITRERGAHGKIVNTLSGAAPSKAAKPAAQKEAGISAVSKTAERRPASEIPARLHEPGSTLIIIPCAGRKQEGSRTADCGGSICDRIPASLAKELTEARARIKSTHSFDESSLVPAWQRYDGALYNAGREGIQRLAEAGCHIIILSGGYGAVLAGEPIGFYDKQLKPADWPDRILERVLEEYARHNRIRSICAFVSATTGYATILRRTRWDRAGAADALLLCPEAARGAMRKAPQSLGEAISAFSGGDLNPAWRSSYGLGIITEQL